MSIKNVPIFLTNCICSNNSDSSRPALWLSEDLSNKTTGVFRREPGENDLWVDKLNPPC